MRSQVAAVVCLGGVFFNAVAQTHPKVVWPTPDIAFLQGNLPETFIQPTEAKTTESGLFGCVRNKGGRFHEGIDLKALTRDRQGEAIDPVFAVMDGRVAYLNDTVGASSYGRYVVLEHFAIEPAIYTLYAHLRDIEPDLKVGLTVRAGHQLGKMGRSASAYYIPSARAHLHFEMGFRLSDNFQQWYNDNEFDEPDYHGNWNGMNLLGFDPLDFYTFYRRGEVDSVKTYIARLPTAFMLQVISQQVPDFIRRYPSLLSGALPGEGVAGWQIEFTWYGLPKRWRPLEDDEIYQGGIEAPLTLVYFDTESLLKNTCRDIIVFTPNGPEVGADLYRVLQLIFGFKNGGRTE